MKNCSMYDYNLYRSWMTDHDGTQSPDAAQKPANKSRRKSDVSGKEKKDSKDRKGDTIRVEHLNYKVRQVGVLTYV